MCRNFSILFDSIQCIYRECLNKSPLSIYLKKKKKVLFNFKRNQNHSTKTPSHDALANFYSVRDFTFPAIQSSIFLFLISTLDIVDFERLPVI